MFTMIAAKNCQAERNEAANQEKQAADKLEAADDVNVAAGKKSVQIFTSHTLRERWHRKEMQESIGTEENEDQSEKDPGDNSKNFHSSTMTSSGANSNSEVVKRRLAAATNHDFSRNSWFRSADAALSARRLNVPFVLMSCAARRNAPQAARARPEPTEMRRTPRSAN